MELYRNLDLERDVKLVEVAHNSGAGPSSELCCLSNRATGLDRHLHTKSLRHPLSTQLKSAFNTSKIKLGAERRSNMAAQPAIRICLRSARSSARKGSYATTTSVFCRSRAFDASQSLHSYKGLVITQPLRYLHVSRQLRGLMPDSSDPPVREAEEHIQSTEPAELTIEEYQVRSDHFFDALVTKLEQRQDEKADVDVEYSVGSQNNSSIAQLLTLVWRYRPVSWSFQHRQEHTS